jgi:hypothetical protein
MAPGALPHPGRVPEQRLLSPKICLRRRRRCRTVLGKTPIDLGFSVGRLLIGEGVSSEVDQGGLTMDVGSLWPPLVVWAASGPPPALVRSSVLFRKK